MFNYLEDLENAEFQDIKKFKKPIAFISFLVLFGGIALLLAPYSAEIIHLLESIRVLKSTTWQVVLSSYGAFALVLSVISLYAIFLRKYPLKVQCYLYGGTVLVLLALIVVTVYKYGNNWIDSDYSSEMVLSKLLSEENKLVSKSWKYSTELHLLFQQIFMMPLFKLFSNWQLIRAMTVFFNNVVLIGAYFFMMRQLKISMQSVMLTSLFLIIPVNITYWDIVTFSGSYVFFIAQFFCCMGLFFKLLTLHDENLNMKKERIVFAVYCAVSLILGMGGIRALMDIQIPLCITCMWIYSKNKIAKRAYPVILSLSSLIACGFGYGINSLLHWFYDFHTYDGIRVSNLYDQFFQKLGNIIFEFVIFFGYSPDSKIFTPNGLFSLFSIILLFCIFFFAVKMSKNQNTVHTQAAHSGIVDSKQFILLFFITSSIYHTILYQLLNSDVIGRYFIPFLILYVPVLAVLFEKIKTKVLPLKSAAFVVCLSTVLFVQGTLKFQEKLQYDTNKIRHGYINYLTENKLHFGFASYWNANVTTELSNGGIEIAPLHPDNIHLIHNWLMPIAYENPDYYKGESFLVLTQAEYEKYKSEDWLLQKTAQYSDDDFIIFRYSSGNDVFESMHIGK